MSGSAGRYVSEVVRERYASFAGAVAEWYEGLGGAEVDPGVFRSALETFAMGEIGLPAGAAREFVERFGDDVARVLAIGKARGYTPEQLKAEITKVLVKKAGKFAAPFVKELVSRLSEEELVSAAFRDGLLRYAEEVGVKPEEVVRRLREGGLSPREYSRLHRYVLEEAMRIHTGTTGAVLGKRMKETMEHLNLLLKHGGDTDRAVAEALAPKLAQHLKIGIEEMRPMLREAVVAILTNAAHAIVKNDIENAKKHLQQIAKYAGVQIPEKTEELTKLLVEPITPHVNQLKTTLEDMKKLMNADRVTAGIFASVVKKMGREHGNNRVGIAKGGNLIGNLGKR